MAIRGNPPILFRHWEDVDSSVPIGIRGTLPGEPPFGSVESNLATC